MNTQLNMHSNSGAITPEDFARLCDAMKPVDAHGRVRTTRRADAEGGISLAKRRTWHANTVAYGFIGSEDLFKTRVNEVGIEVVNKMVTDSIAKYEEQVSELMSAFVERTTVPRKRFRTGNIGTLQPLDNLGNPLPRKQGDHYTIGFPIQGGGDAWGTDRESRAKMTVADENEFALNVIGADTDWLARHILAAVFTNTSWTYTDKDDKIGDLTVVGLANGDGTKYLLKNGKTITDNHYAAQASAIDDSHNPIPNIRTGLLHHMGNTGKVVTYIAENLRDDIEGLEAFREPNDPDLRRSLTEDEFVGEEITGFGDDFVGYVNRTRIVEWGRLPDNYILGHVIGGQQPVAMREHEEEEIQGLFPEFQNVDGNRHLNKFIRYAGFGVQDRTAAFVMRIGDAFYAIPPGFEAPLAV